MFRYQSTKMGVYQAEDLITTYLSYQESIKRCICIVYDPHGMGSGSLPLRAVTLKDTFAEAAKKEGVLSLTFEKLRAKGVSRKDIFEEIPITLHNSPLAAAMATALEPEVRPTATCSSLPQHNGDVAEAYEVALANLPHHKTLLANGYHRPLVHMDCSPEILFIIGIGLLRKESHQHIKDTASRILAGTMRTMAPT